MRTTNHYFHRQRRRLLFYSEDGLSSKPLGHTNSYQNLGYLTVSTLILTLLLLLYFVVKVSWYFEMTEVQPSEPLSPLTIIRYIRTIGWLGSHCCPLVQTSNLFCISRWGGFSVYATLISWVFTIYLIATCFGHTTIFKQTYICLISHMQQDTNIQD
jgi:hypothetical protein